MIQMKSRLLQRTSFFVILIAAISVAVLAQQQQPLQISPSVDRLRQHVSYLASDALEGRRTGSPGANDAAHYIAGEFSRLGLRPATQTARAPKTRGEALSRFLQRFPYVAGVQLGKGNEMALATEAAATPGNLRVGEDWMPLGLSSNARIENARATFVGYGITVSDLKYDNYATANAAGSIAIALSGTPDGDNAHGQFARYEDVRWKAIAARNAGAKALVVVAREENFKDDRLSLLHYDNSGGDVGLAVAGISRQALQRVLKMPLSDIEGALKQQLVTSVRLPNVSVTIATDIVRQEVAASNVIGILEGSDSTLKSQYVFFTGHMDHIGTPGSGEGCVARGADSICNGADDDGPGTTAVLETAEAFAQLQPRPKRSLVFMTVSGEERGLWGSQWYSDHPTLPLANTVADLNTDMVGRNWKDTIAVIGKEHSDLGATLNRIGAAHPELRMTPIDDIWPQENFYFRSDHYNFARKGVPILFFFNGTHPDYHEVGDSPDKIDAEKESRIIKLVFYLGLDIANAPDKPKWNPDSYRRIVRGAN